ncbi:hypothetical protein [Micromonospora sp. CPCC 206061]|uniref:hypothetical protein n=1 Tax=Micromonospora sp. CPCC 206061 TaxID=3122410 RepID=UPI002FF3D232
MLIPVLEVGSAGLAAPWPMADNRSMPSLPGRSSVVPDRLLPLSGALDRDELGLAVAVMVEYAGGDALKAADAPSVLAAFVESIPEAEALAVPGGLALVDAGAGIRIEPGCCFGLESWREWARVPAGESPWLGHSPDPWIEHRPDGTLRVWAGSDTVKSAHIDTTTAALAGMLGDAERALDEFVDQVEHWARTVAPDDTGTFAGLLRRGLRLRH